jgi:uncharacterized membrane protein
MEFTRVIELAAQLMEGMGVAVIGLGVLWATLRFVANLRRPAAGVNTYKAYRLGLAQAILLGLEILVAGDIIRTVAIEPTLTSVGVLAAIVGIRTVLSFSLQLEIEGRWPWQQPAAGAEPAGD